MDLATVVGLVGALGLIVAAMAMGVGVGPYIDGQSVVIVVIGSIMTLFINFKMEHMKSFAKVLMLAIKPSYVPDYEALIKKTCRLCYTSKKRWNFIT